MLPHKFAERIKIAHHMRFNEFNNLENYEKSSKRSDFEDILQQPKYPN